MAYSKAYQTVIAGRTREDEQPFFRQNKTALLSGVWSAQRTGGSKQQPVITKEWLKVERVGKIPSTVAAKNMVVSAYDAGSNNVNH